MSKRHILWPHWGGFRYFCIHNLTHGCSRSLEGIFHFSMFENLITILAHLFPTQTLQPAGQSLSLTKIAVVEGFEYNRSGRRAYRIGVDVSLWYRHTEKLPPQAGANAKLRLLFFRLAGLARLPWLVLFMFDGCERPKVKRGSRMGKSGSHNLTPKFKVMIECFGMEWRTVCLPGFWQSDRRNIYTFLGPRRSRGRTRISQLSRCH